MPRGQGCSCNRYMKFIQLVLLFPFCCYLEVFLAIRNWQIFRRLSYIWSPSTVLILLLFWSLGLVLSVWSYTKPCMVVSVPPYVCLCVLFWTVSICLLLSFCYNRDESSLHAYTRNRKPKTTRTRSVKKLAGGLYDDTYAKARKVLKYVQR